MVQVVEVKKQVIKANEDIKGDPDKDKWDKQFLKLVRILYFGNDDAGFFFDCLHLALDPFESKNVPKIHKRQSIGSFYDYL